MEKTKPYLRGALLCAALAFFALVFIDYASQYSIIIYLLIFALLGAIICLVTVFILSLIKGGENE